MSDSVLIFETVLSLLLAIQIYEKSAPAPPPPPPLPQFAEMSGAAVPRKLRGIRRFRQL